MEHVQLNDLRRHVKPLGYKIKTKSFSFGRSLTYVHIESGEELTGNVFTKETLEKWKPLFLYLDTYKGRTLADGQERITGSYFSKK